MKKLIIALLAIAIAITTLTWFMRLRKVSAYESCHSVLLRIDAKKQEWAVENHANGDAKPTWDDLFGKHGKQFAKCPQGGVYTIGKIRDAPTCSISNHTLTITQNGK